MSPESETPMHLMDPLHDPSFASESSEIGHPKRMAANSHLATNHHIYIYIFFLVYSEAANQGTKEYGITNKVYVMSSQVTSSLPNSGKGQVWHRMLLC